MQRMRCFGRNDRLQELLQGLKDGDSLNAHYDKKAVRTAIALERKNASISAKNICDKEREGHR